jgi:methionyl-tRNA formyltransferase
VALIAPVVTEALALLVAGGTDWIQQDRSKAGCFHKRSLTDSRIDWSWPAEHIDRPVRARPIPTRTRSPATRDGCCGSSGLRFRRAATAAPPSQIFIRKGDGVVVMAGADARFGRNHGQLVEQVCTDGADLLTTAYFLATNPGA